MVKVTASSSRNKSLGRNLNKTSIAKSRWGRPALGGWLVFLSLIPFVQSIWFDFINFDDEGYVTENTLTTSGFSFDSICRLAVEPHMGNWHPLTMLTYMFEYSLVGAMPGVYHLNNVLLHVATTYLLFDWLRRTTQSPNRSFLVALLFGIHPLRAESVAWISERKDVLCGFFWILSLRAYSEYAFARTIKSYVFVCIWTALSMLAKPMAVTLPCVMLLVDIWPLRRWQLGLPAWFSTAANSNAPIEMAATSSTRTEKFVEVSPSKLFQEKLVLFGMALTIGIITIKAQDDAIQTLEVIPLVTRFQTAVVGTVLYLEKTLFPVGLAPYYPRPVSGWSPSFIAGCVTLLMCLSIAAVVELRRRPFLFVGWFWFLGVLLPVSGLLQAGTQLMADRYSYLPSVGLLIAAVWLFPTPNSPLENGPDPLKGIVQTWNSRCPEWVRLLFQRAAKTKFVLRSCWVMIIVIAVALETLTMRQVYHWRGAIPLFEHTVAVTSDNVIAHDMLGSAYFHLGQADAARRQYELSLKIDPNSLPAQTHLALLAEKEGNFDLALQLRKRAVEIDTQSPDSAISLARFFDRKGDRNTAIETLQHVLEKHPWSAQALVDLGFLYNQLKQPERACDYYRRAIAVDPRFSMGHFNLGNLLVSQGNIDEAIPHFKLATRYHPEMYLAHFSLARIYLDRGDLVTARRELRSCLAVSPNFAPARQLENALRKHP